MFSFKALGFSTWRCDFVINFSWIAVNCCLNTCWAVLTFEHFRCKRPPSLGMLRPSYNIEMKEDPSHFSWTMRMTSPSTSIPLILMKVTEAMQADLNMTSIQYWAPHQGAATPWHLSWAYESPDIYTWWLVLSGMKPKGSGQILALWSWQALQLLARHDSTFWFLSNLFSWIIKGPVGCREHE